MFEYHAVDKDVAATHNHVATSNEKAQLNSLSLYTLFL